MIKIPYKDIDQKRQYQLVWMWRRRLAWILENGPCSWCGSCADLQVSWKNPSRKVVKVASIWSRSDEKRTELLSECEVLCGGCHQRKMKIWRAVKAAKAALSKEDDMPDRR